MPNKPNAHTANTMLKRLRRRIGKANGELSDKVSGALYVVDLLLGSITVGTNLVLSLGSMHRHEHIFGAQRQGLKRRGSVFVLEHV